MKKNIIYSALCACLMFSTTSCSDFFEPTIKGSVDADEFYNSLNNLRLGLNATFNVMQKETYQRGELIFGEAISDNCWNAEDVGSGDMYDLLNFTFTTENPYILERYEVNYLGINKANQVISAVADLEYKSETSTLKELREVYGQAKLLRALFYFNLVKTYGGVSIQPENQELTELIVPRSSQEEVYAYIEKDLRESLLLLRRSRYTLTEAGQQGVGAALGLLMKVLLYQGSPGIELPTVDKTEKLEQARQIGQFFIDGVDITYDDILQFSANYTDETWEEVMDRLILESTDTPETVFLGQDVVSIHYLDAFDNLFRLSGEFSAENLFEISHYDYSGVGIDVDESWKLESYITYDPAGTSVITVTPTSNLYSTFGDDPRLLFTASYQSLNNYYKQEESTPSIGWFNYGDRMKFTKYYVFPSDGESEGRNYRVMRYAEALLIYAEVVNTLGDSPKAVDLLNRVRTRAYNLFTSSTTSTYQTASASTFSMQAYAPADIVETAILNEKRMEMAGEFDRWFEICRLGTVATRMSWLASNPASDSYGTRVRGLYFKKGVNEIFPIPYEEVFISNGVIEQNFGY